MTFLHIRYFCMVAECQSISRAAKALIVSQPALSKMIRSLEDELGVSLFLREGRKMMLTADGRFFYESAVNSLAILDNAVNALTNRSQVKEIRVCINSGDLFMEEMIAEYHLQHEDIFFQIFAEAQATEPHRGGAYDLAVYTRAENQPLPGNVHPLLTESFGLAIPIRDPLSQCQSIALEQVKDRAFLATDTYGLNYRLCREHGFTPRLVIVGQNLHAYMKMLEYETGISIVPALTFGKYLPKNCRYVPIENFIKTRTLVIEEANTYSRDHVRDFLNFCLEKSAQLQQTDSTAAVN